MEDKYFLFGWDACNIYDEKGVEGIMKEVNDFILKYDIYHWQRDSKPEELLDNFSGWEEYRIISEQDYKQLVF